MNLKIQPDIQDVIDRDVVLLVDSNLKKIIPEKMNNNTSCVKFYCPTLTHIDSLLGKSEIKRSPHTIFIHCGTNHIYPDTKNTSILEDEYIELLMKLRDLFPNAKIVISALLPRGEGQLRPTVQYVNDFLYGVCCSDSQLTFMRNFNIHRHQLVDRKHLNDEAFLILLSNIRYTLFGKIPRYKRRR